MDIEKIIKEFTLKKPKGYEKDVRVFIESYEEKGLQVGEIVLQGVKTKQIIESIDYYIRQGNVKKISPVNRYASAIAEFFKYIIGNEYINNKELYDELLLPKEKPESYWYLVNEAIINNKNLQARETFDIFQKEEVIKLIKDCNAAISVNSEKAINCLTNSKTEDSSKFYNKVLSALCFKLISLTGVSYRSLKKIEISEEIIEYNILDINGYKFYLPVCFSKQLKEYIKLREMILSKNSKASKYLFIAFNGEQMAGDTGLIIPFLVEYTGRSDLNGLIKYAIREMINIGINDSAIKKFTGIGKDIFTQCLDNENQNNSMYWNRYLDSKIRSIETFDML